MIEFLSFNFKNEKEPWLRSSIWMKEGREFILSCSFSKSSVSVEIERDRSKRNGRFSPNGSVHHVSDVLQFCGFRYRELCLVHSGDVMIFFKLSTFFLVEAGMKSRITKFKRQRREGRLELK